MDGILGPQFARVSKSLYNGVETLTVERRHEMNEVVDYLPTDLISGTNPGSRNAYETPLSIVPISNARTNFLEEPA